MSTIIHNDLSREITVHGINKRVLNVSIPQDADHMHIEPLGKTGRNLVTIFDVMGNILWRRHSGNVLVFSPYEATHFTYRPVSAPVKAEEFLPERADGEVYMGFRSDDIEFEQV